LPKDVTPEDIFQYAYAVFHSPTYRTRYAEFLKLDFPRLPLTSNRDLFFSLASLGGELAGLHLMESPTLNDIITEFPEKGTDAVEKVQYTDKDKRVWINPTQYFAGVSSAVWNFHIGGYQVCEKWLKDRKGRTLTYEDIQHYQKIVVALNETIRLMAEIDQVIETQGGWPAAFSGNKI
jgi:predicted helicase